MPSFPGGVGTRYAETSFIDVHGDTLIIREENLHLSVTDAQILAYQNAMGDLSNAAIFKEIGGKLLEADIADAIAFDEAESSVNTGANMRFQNTVTLQTRSFRVPAIDMDAVDSSGNFLKAWTRNAQVDAAAVAILAMLGVDWVYTYSTISTEASASEITPDEVYVPDPEESGVMELFELNFVYTDAPTLFLITVPALATITSVRLHIETPFDVPAALKIGDEDVKDRLMSITDNNPLEVGVYELEPDYEYPAVTSLYMSITALGATSGAGRIVLEYDKE